MPERLTDEELRLLDRRDELYALDADERIPHAAQLLLEKERDAIEQHFGDRLDPAIALWREDRERQAPPLTLTNEERRLLDRRDELLGSLYGSKSHDDHMPTPEEERQQKKELEAIEQRFGDRLDAALSIQRKERERNSQEQERAAGLPPLTDAERRLLSDEDRRLLDRREELYDLDADTRIPHAAQIILEKERDAIEQHFGDRLDSAIAIRMRERQEERERQATPLALTKEERRLLDRRDELLGSLYGSKSHDGHVPTPEEERQQKEELEAIEQRFGDRLDAALSIQREERERQAPQAEKTREARKPLVERINDCVKLLKSRLVEKIREAVSPAQKLYYSRRKEGLEVMKKELAHDKNLSRGQALGVAR